MQPLPTINRKLKAPPYLQHDWQPEVSVEVFTRPAIYSGRDYSRMNAWVKPARFYHQARVTGDGWAFTIAFSDNVELLSGETVLMMGEVKRNIYYAEAQRQDEIKTQRKLERRRRVA